MSTRTLFSLALILLLSACAAERQARRATADDATCQSWGAPVGTPGYISCREALVGQHSQEDAQRQASSGALMNYGLGLYNSSQPRAPMTTHCTPNIIGRPDLGVTCQSF